MYGFEELFPNQLGASHFREDYCRNARKSQQNLYECETDQRLVVKLSMTVNHFILLFQKEQYSRVSFLMPKEFDITSAVLICKDAEFLS